MNVVYYLASCSTCIKILKKLPQNHNLILRDIKSQPLTVADVEAMQKLASNYEALFSRKAKLFQELGLKNQVLTEAAYKKYLLEHYTFLKRPVFIINNAIFIGNSTQNISAVLTALQN
jgi:arsenate reductase